MELKTVKCERCGYEWGIIVTCPNCGGGLIAGYEHGGLKRCPTCHGKGTVIQEIEGEKP